MYPIQCPGGFSVPTKAGKFEVCGFCVTVETPASASEFAIVDDPGIDQSGSTGRILPNLTDQKNILAHIKGLAAGDAVLSYEFSEPIKTRYGISIYSTNTLAGSMCVYRR